MEQFDLILRTVMGGERTPASRGLTQEQRNTILFERASRDSHIDFLDVLDVDGGVLASLRPGEPPRNWATRDYFYAVRDNPTKEIYAGAPFSTKSEASVGFTVSRRIAAGDGRFAGVVVMGVRLAAVRELLNRQKLGTSEAVTLMRDDGTVLMRLPFDLKDIGHPIEPFAPFHAFSRTGQSSVSTRVTSDGAAQRLVFRRVDGYPLVVGVATLPEEDGRGWPYLPWAFGSAATVGIGCWLLVRRLWRERRLREAAQHQSTEALLVGRRT
jgi:hypothetical protein